MIPARERDPRKCGVALDIKPFTDICVNEFNAYAHGNFTVDEMLLFPLSAHAFCDMVRARLEWRMAPDNLILGALMARRKSPTPNGPNPRPVMK